MIRKANYNDVDLINETYNEHFKYEEENTAYTIFRRGIFPTKEIAEKAVKSESMYVYEENGIICGSIIADQNIPEDYKKIKWKNYADRNEVMVIHLLLVRPSMSGKGIASQLLEFVSEKAKENNCKVLRLDTGKQNIPAIKLYKKSGFEIVSEGYSLVGNVIEHKEHLFLEKEL